MEAVTEQLVHYATLAPSGHNTQPWLFSTDQDTVRIFPDLRRRLPVVDPDDHALYISLGCALENLLIAAARHGLETAVEYFPADEPVECLRVRLSPGQADDVEALFRAIPERQSNRRSYDGRPIPEHHVRRVLEANRCESVAVRAFDTSEPEIEPIIGFVREGNIAQFNDTDFVEELVSWIRFTKQDARARRDGLAAEALGFPQVPRCLGRWIMTTLVKPGGEATRQERAIRSSSLVLLFIANHDDKSHWVDLGRAFERTALTATSLGIAHAHVNMPCEVESVRRKLAAHLGLPGDAQPLLLIRLGFGKRLASSLRRPAAQVLRDDPVQAVGDALSRVD